MVKIINFKLYFFSEHLKIMFKFLHNQPFLNIHTYIKQANICHPSIYKDNSTLDFYLLLLKKTSYLLWNSFLHF